jgi:hypothetical protein|tara:strand:- start:169 stop:531 length:363 start_codon:yes stop_codon:yes gene_type:complete
MAFWQVDGITRYAIILNKQREKKHMKKLILTIAILIGLSTSAQAVSKSQFCSMMGQMASQLVSSKTTVPLSRAITLVESVGFTGDFKSYAYGVVAIAYDTDLSASQYSQAVTLNCLQEDL